MHSIVTSDAVLTLEASSQTIALMHFRTLKSSLSIKANETRNQKRAFCTISFVLVFWCFFFVCLVCFSADPILLMHIKAVPRGVEEGKKNHIDIKIIKVRCDEFLFRSLKHTNTSYCI